MPVFATQMCRTSRQNRRNPDEQNGNSVAKGVYQVAAAYTKAIQLTENQSV